MEEFDVLVLGGGTGNNVASAAARDGYETALVEEDKVGGTCLNRGCNPSKMLLQRAKIVSTIDAADKFGITAHIDEIDHEAVMNDVWETLDGIAASMGEAKRKQDNLSYYNQRGEFVDDKVIELDDGTRLQGDKIVIAAGSRPIVPDAIDGLQDGPYKTGSDIMRQSDLPEEIVVVGGGYIAAELGYYLDAMGTDVTLVEMESTLLPREDRAVSRAFTEVAQTRHDVRVNHRVESVEYTDAGVTVYAQHNGQRVDIQADEVLIALGRRPNADTIGLENTAVTIDENGFIEVDDSLQTTVDDIWAQGDIAGNWMFKHSGDHETDVVIDNVVNNADRTVNYRGMSHAIFTSPEVGAVGHREQELEDKDIPYVVGSHDYADTAMGRARKLDKGFVKVLAHAETGELLGCHLFGDEASDLVHEATIAMRHDLTVQDIADTIYVHPTMSKVVRAAFNDAANSLTNRSE